MENLKSTMDKIKKTEIYEKYRILEDEYQHTENLLQKLLINQENEKKNLSWELYHVVAQTLYSILLGIKVTIDSGVDDRLKAYLKKLEKSVEEVLKKVRRMSFDLYPQVIYDLGFVAALTHYINLLKEDGYDIQFKMNGVMKKCHNEKETLIYRISSEIINFIIYELKVNSIKIILSFYEETDNRLFFQFNQEKKACNEKIIRAGLGITQKKIIGWNGKISIRPFNQEMKEWSIEVIIP